MKSIEARITELELKIARCKRVISDSKNEMRKLEHELRYLKTLLTDTEVT